MDFSQGLLVLSPRFAEVAVVESGPGSGFGPGFELDSLEI